ncbi:non-canonical purine NTP pyrophosphatase [Iamia sp.]|uniref:non-canonical purine NTP pyrophosphatase n=1 Tax=Iamia sp. TaxID=2722710 RepID=UPI002C5FA507|nr:non-canonical purine NTP pyrophosphatase [Iamia sp.]HXH58940.1 non-canonical purine NTP pyrophosphatase [Iamia sp.]
MTSDGAPLRLVLATANPHKATEIRAILRAAGAAGELVARPESVPEVVEDADTLEGNARLKAAALAAATGLPALADDTGLEVDALGGAPGVQSAYYGGGDHDSAANVARVLDEMARTRRASRTARFRTAALIRWPDGRELCALGTVEGVIAPAPEGDGGFGYDPIFRPAGGAGRTFALMGAAEKDALSHRGRALRALAVLLVES